MLARRCLLALLPLLLSLLIPAASGRQATRFPGQDRDLIVAIVRGDTDTVAAELRREPEAARRLLGDGPMNERYDSRETGLSIAVRNHRMEIARLLLESGADPGRKGGPSVGLLGEARFPEMVQLLLETGADARAFARTLPSGKLGVGLERSPRDSAVCRTLEAAGVEIEAARLVQLGRSEELIAEISRRALRARGAHELLYHAIEKGDGELLVTLLERGVPVTGSPPTGPYSNWGYPRTVLEWALFEGDAASALALLEAGATVDATAGGWDVRPGMRWLDPAETIDESGDLLDRAIDLGSIELFDALASRGLDPSASRVTRGDARTILHGRLMRAAWRGHHGVLQRLLDAAETGNVDVRLEPLQLAAAAGGHADLRRVLVERAGFASPHAAAAIGDVEALKARLRNVEEALESVDPVCGVTPLTWAVIMENEDAVDLLLDRGADPEVRVDRDVARSRWEGRPGTVLPRPEVLDDPGGDPLLERANRVQRISLVEAALRRDRIAIAALLVRAGARVEPEELALIARDPSEEAGRLLRETITRGSVVRADDLWAQRALVALVHGSARGEWAMTRLDFLLESGGDATLRAAESPSIVDRGYASGAPPELLRALRDRGSQVSDGVAVALGWRDSRASRTFIDGLEVGAWKSLLHGARSRPEADCYARLFQLRSEVARKLAIQQVHRLAYAGRIDLIDVVLPRCGDGYDHVRDPEVLGNGADHADFVRELLRRGADPNHAEPSGFGPLHNAARAGALESVRLLLEAGANPNARSTDGRAPLYEVTTSARGMRSPEAEERVLGVIDALLGAGADPCSVDDAGRVTFESLLWQDWSDGGRNRLHALLARHVDQAWLGH